MARFVAQVLLGYFVIKMKVKGNYGKCDVGLAGLLCSAYTSVGIGFHCLIFISSQADMWDGIRI